VSPDVRGFAARQLLDRRFLQTGELGKEAPLGEELVD
jgi:hypothetical protein